MKKIIAITLAAAIFCTAAAACSVSSKKEYPVTVANYTLTTKPSSVVCLSDSVADILIACGYSAAITARSEECTQEELKSLQSIGSAENPDIKKIIALKPDIVFGDASTDKTVADKLEENGITLMKMIHARNISELTTLYKSIGTVMEGDISGKENGIRKAASLVATLDQLKSVVPESDVIVTACYLYNENGFAATLDTFSGKLFEYARVENVCRNTNTKLENLADIGAIKLANPNYIFCDVGLKDKLKNNVDFAGLDAVKNDRIYEIDANAFERQGDTMTEVLSFIIETVYPELSSEGETSQQESSPQESKPQTSQQESSPQESKPQTSQQESSPQESKPQTSQQESSTQESKPQTSQQESSTQESKPEASQQESSTQSSEPAKPKVPADNSLTIDDTSYYGNGDNGEDTRIIQTRLSFLGYFNEQTTGFFGDATEEAFREFEKNNKLEPDGIATPEDLKLLFSDKVKPDDSYTGQ